MTESAYVRFTDTPSPFTSLANSENHDFNSSEPPSPVLEQVPENATVISRVSQFWHSLFQAKEPQYQSQYLTLIPLSDARLKPRRTRLIVSVLLLLAVAAVTSVFLVVPREVSVGTIQVHSTRITFNATTLTYRILLVADVPFQNANYMQVRAWGNVTVSFFDAEAGWTVVEGFNIARRTANQVLHVKVDASNLPRKYTQVVYTQCFNFPQKLVFFILTTFKVRYLGYTYDLPHIDTYFMLDCSSASNTALQQQQQQHRPWQQQQRQHALPGELAMLPLPPGQQQQQPWQQPPWKWQEQEQQDQQQQKQQQPQKRKGKQKQQ